MVDLKFTDLLGTWQHVSLPLTAFDEDAFEEGLGFDGSSIRGWKGIPSRTCCSIPDPATAMLDPFTGVPTLSLICGIVDPITREPYERDPRLIVARRPRRTWSRRASPTPPTSARRPSSSSSTTSRTT